MDDGEALELGPGSVYEIPPGHDAWVIGDEPWITIDTSSGRPMTGMMDAPGERIIATVLFSDIVDSTALAAKLGDAAWSERLLAHNQRIRAELNAYRGREISTTGDGFLAVFDSASRAVLCAAAMTKAAATLGLAIRIGIHTGEIAFVGETHAAWPSMPRHAYSRLPDPARSWSRLPPATCWRVPASTSRTRACTS